MIARHHQLCPQMKHILLTRGKRAIVDEAEFVRLNAHKWTAHLNKLGRWDATREVYAYDITTRKLKKVMVTMPEFVIGKRPNKEIDHKNLKTLDNRKSNLRHATRTEQSRNRNRYNKLGYKGVFKNGAGFSARIVVEGRRKYLGYFDTVQEAAEAYNNGARQYYGEFARLNRVWKGKSAL